MVRVRPADDWSALSPLEPCHSHHHDSREGASCARMTTRRKDPLSPNLPAWQSGQGCWAWVVRAAKPTGPAANPESRKWSI